MEQYCDATLLPEMRAVAADASIVTSTRSDARYLQSDPGSEAELLVKRLAGNNHTEAVSYATDGGYFQKQGWPTVICGPGSIEQAHKPDEFIRVADLADCVAFLDRLAIDLALTGSTAAK